MESQFLIKHNPQIIKTYSFSIIDKKNSKNSLKKNPSIPLFNSTKTIIKNRTNSNNKRPKSSINSSNILNYDYYSIINQPKISKREQDKVFNALYNDSKYRKEKLKRLNEKKEEQLKSIYTFSPKQIPNKFNERYNKKLIKSQSRIDLNNYNLNDNLNYNYNNSNYINFYNRLENYERKKKENLIKIKNDIFDTIPHPKMIKMNIKDLQLPYNSKKFLSIKKQKIEKLRENIINEKGITFKPKLNENINSCIKNNFQERNEAFIKSKETKLNNIYEDDECTFSPKINYESSLIQFNSSIENRLYNYKKYYDKNLEYTRIKNEKIYPFHPKISKNTNLILENRRKNIEYIKQNPYFNNYDSVIHFSREKEFDDSINHINEKNEKVTLIKKSKSDKNFHSNEKTNIINKNTLIENIKYKFKNLSKRNFNDNNLGYKYFGNAEEKEKPTTNCSSINSKSIVNLNYYDNLI